MDPLQPLPRRPKPSAPGAWILAGLLLPLAVLVLWLNVRPKGVSLQQRVEQGRDGILRLFGMGPQEALVDPAIVKEAAPSSAADPRRHGQASQPALSRPTELAEDATAARSDTKKAGRKGRKTK